jgi:hypothetical protein
MSETTKTGLTHYIVSVERFVSEHGLQPAATAVLLSFWSQTHDPFAEQPTVWVSRARTAARIGITAGYVQRMTQALLKAGAITAGVPARGRGIRYTLLRPVHTPEDAKLNPFTPTEAVTAAAAILELLRADGRTAVAKKRPARKRVTKPAIKPSDIAVALEDMAGFAPVFKTDGKGEKTRRPTLPYSPKAYGGKTPPAVTAAQAFIVQHGAAAFVAVCERAQLRGEWAPTKEERALLFEQHAFVAELLAEGTPEQTPAAPAPETEQVVQATPPERAAELLAGLWPRADVDAFMLDHGARACALNSRELHRVIIFARAAPGTTLLAAFEVQS